MLWKTQTKFNQVLFTREAYEAIKDTIFFQRRWKTPLNRYCSLLPELHVAPNALPSVQLLNVYKSVNSLVVLTTDGKRRLNDAERSTLVRHLKGTRRVSISLASQLIGLEIGSYLADDHAVVHYLEGNATAAAWLEGPNLMEIWRKMPLDLQDKVTQKIISEETDESLIEWLMGELDLEINVATEIVRLKMPQGLSDYSLKATRAILNYMQDEGADIEVAISNAGFGSVDRSVRAIKFRKQETLPYYGTILHEYLGSGTNNSNDCDEIRYGRIGKPSIHISLNQLRLIVNALITEYGKPSEISISFSKGTPSKTVDSEAALSSNSKGEPFQVASGTSGNADVLGYGLQGISFERLSKELTYPQRLYSEYLTVLVDQSVRAVPQNLVSNLRSLIVANDSIACIQKSHGTDYRTYVTDACVLAAIDQHLVKKASSAFIDGNQAAQGLSSLFLPWPTFCAHLTRVLRSVKASHRPDHCYKGKIHKETAYRPSSEGFAEGKITTMNGQQKTRKKIKLIPMSKTSDPYRHSKNLALVNGNYKGYAGMSNYCIDIIAKDSKTWIGKVITTFEAYDRHRRAQAGETALPPPYNLVMRLHLNDCISIHSESGSQCLRVIRISDRVITFVDVNQCYPHSAWAGKAPIISKTPGALRKASATATTINVLGRITRSKGGPPRNLAF